MHLKFDTWLINRLEKICQCVAQLTGQTNFFWAKLCILLATLSGFLMLMSVHWYIFLPIIMIFFLLYISGAIVAEKEAEARLEQGLANPRKVTEYSVRYFNSGVLLAVLIMAILPPPITYFEICNTLFIAFYLFSSYLMACDTKPPVKSLVRQWFEALTTKKVLVLSNETK